MCTGIAIATSELPARLAEDVRLKDRLYNREGRAEYQFQWWQSPTLLPVLWNGAMHLLPWGSKDRRSRLPYGGWISREHLGVGILQYAKAEDAVIPANLGHHRGTWYLIVEGIHALVVRTPAGPTVYMVVEPSTNYYRNMTEQEPLMPALVGQVI